ncbi:MAG: glycosyltransferase family 4 protein, partial [Clostridia bacterium]
QWYGETVQDDYQRALATLLAPVRERVHFAGFVPYAQMPAMYAAGDVAVLPSIWEEPSGLTLLEAQASGMPVITTRAGGIPDNVSQESAVLLARGDGLVQALADAMDMLFIDAEMREKMARAGKQFLRGRDIPDYYRAFAALLA